ncbi:citrulline utilization hydrolase CtlX [Pontibacter sp. G13]|uniref:citrulline utilization hydrolase CtlX n=1 Tax=Pontibacter sp. G13 TaxID=3074898 RepID=UPI00288BDADC|nr:arginine deiminase-related protein [Pontibacter sp. G13]WNJ16349.1 arginine deiminase-related protein [Pontibacter sp. G13]
MEPLKPSISSQQTTHHLMMVRPIRFGYNAETATNNAFQHEDKTHTPEEIQSMALAEFDRAVSILRDAGVEVSVIEDTPEPFTPDSIFPNNWISFHADGTILQYPMFAENRRKERRPEIVDEMASKYSAPHHLSLADLEEDGLFLEGTGSMILDRKNRIAYANRSPRTHEEAFEIFCSMAGYTGVLFTATDGQGQDIYHTNVLMALGRNLAVLCLDSVENPDDKDMLQKSLARTGHDILAISREQVNQFAGNMLEVQNGEGKPYWVMSQRAYDSLTTEQKAQISQSAEPLVVPLDVIETQGGGSVRCMMAEVFLPQSPSS